MREGALIAFGSNDLSVWGSPAETVAAAMARVARLSQGAVARSALFATPAFPAGSGPDYVNAAMRIATNMPAETLLAALHGIEAMAGRVRQTRWGQRTLDLDLLALGDRVLPDMATYAAWRDLAPEAQASRAPDRLILPHPRLQDRAFVLVPLCQIAADWRHPVSGLTARALCDALPVRDRAAVRPLDGAETP